MTADLLLIGHGSRNPRASAEFATLADLVAARLPEHRVAGGFLELADPPIDRAVDDLVAAGATDVVAVPSAWPGTSASTRRCSTWPRSGPGRRAPPPAGRPRSCWWGAAPPTRTPARTS